MSGMRPLGFCCRRERARRSARMRARARAPGRVAMTGVRARLAGLPGRAGSLGDRCGGRRRRPARSAGGDFGRCLGRWVSAGGARCRLVLVQALHFLLQDAHGLAERARRRREVLRPEQHDDHQGDDQDLPRAIEQVTNHLQILSGAGVSRAWLMNRAQDQARTAAAPPGGARGWSAGRARVSAGRWPAWCVAAAGQSSGGAGGGEKTGGGGVLWGLGVKAPFIVTSVNLSYYYPYNPLPFLPPPPPVHL